MNALAGFKDYYKRLDEMMPRLPFPSIELQSLPGCRRDRRAEIYCN